MSIFGASWWRILRPAAVILVVAGSWLVSATANPRQPVVQALDVQPSVEGPPAYYTLHDEIANYALEYPAAWRVEYDPGWLTTLYPVTSTTTLAPTDATPPKIEIIPVIGATTLGQLFEEVRVQGPEIRDIVPQVVNGVPALQLDITTFTGEPARLLLVVFGEQGLRVMAYGDPAVLGPILDSLRPARVEQPESWRL